MSAEIERMREEAIESIWGKERAQRQSLMLAFGRALFFLTLIAAVLAGAMHMWRNMWICAGLSGIGSAMWMLGAIEARLIEIAAHLDRPAKP